MLFYVQTWNEVSGCKCIRDYVFSFPYINLLTRFGAVHDGSGPEPNIPNHPGALRPECGWGEGFIMSYLEHPTNSFRFSTCTYDQIVFTLQYVFNN